MASTGEARCHSLQYNLTHSSGNMAGRCGKVKSYMLENVHVCASSGEKYMYNCSVGQMYVDDFGAVNTLLHSNMLSLASPCTELHLSLIRSLSLLTVKVGSECACVCVCVCVFV